MIRPAPGRWSDNPAHILALVESAKLKTRTLSMLLAISIAALAVVATGLALKGKSVYFVPKTKAVIVLSWDTP